MAQESLNKMKWNTFAKQAKGSDIAEIHVNREERAGQVVLKYNGKNKKGGRLVAGEWVIERAGKDDAAITAAIKEFLERARKDFFVKREAGLAGEAFSAKQEEEAAKAKQIVGKPDEKA